jgi:hypothetical protein
VIENMDLPGFGLHELKGQDGEFLQEPYLEPANISIRELAGLARPSDGRGSLDP